MRIRGAVLEESGRPGPYAESRPITVGELELAEPGPDELLVRIEAAGVCHSDLSVVDGNRPRPLPMLQPESTPPSRPATTRDSTIEEDLRWGMDLTFTMSLD